MAGQKDHLRRHHLDHAASELSEETWDQRLRMTLAVLIISVTVWAICAVLRTVVHVAADGLLLTGLEHTWGPWALVAALTLGGLVQGALHRRPAWVDARGDGVDVTLAHYHSTYDHLADDPQPRYNKSAFGLLWRKATLTTITLSSGASGGLEGPVVLMGECAGAGWSRVLRIRSEFELRTYQLVGVSAAVGSLLGAPFAAALFATELAFSDRIIYRKLVYALLGAVVVYGLNNHLLGPTPLLVAPERPGVYRLGEYLEVVAVALAVSAPVAIGMGLVLKHTHGLLARVPPLLTAPLAAAASGGLALALWFTLGLAPHHLLGMGEHTLAELLNGGTLHSHFEPTPLTTAGILGLAVVGKMITTALTVQSGGSAGMLIPAMFMGGVSGAATHHLLVALGLGVGVDPAIFVVAGIASALVAVIQVPLSAIALVLEVFGPAYGPAAALSCGLCTIVTRKFSMYPQRHSPNPEGDEVG
ncbi:MAG: chloride channel protein [Bradymonadia bacterium]